MHKEHSRTLLNVVRKYLRYFKEVSLQSSLAEESCIEILESSLE